MDNGRIRLGFVNSGYDLINDNYYLWRYNTSLVFTNNSASVLDIEYSCGGLCLENKYAIVDSTLTLFITDNVDKYFAIVLADDGFKITVGGTSTDGTDDATAGITTTAGECSLSLHSSGITLDTGYVLFLFLCFCIL